MLKRVLNNKVNIELICGGLIAPIIFLAWCLSTIAYQSPIYMLIATLFFVVAMLLYGFIWKYCWDDESVSKKECIAINLLITIVSLLLIFIVETDFQKNCRLGAYLGLFFGLIVCTKNFVHILKDSHFTFSGFGQYICRYKYLFLVLLAIGYLSIEGVSYPLKWDGLLYYDAVKNAAISSLSSLALYGHVSVFAGFVYRLFFSLFGLGWHGMVVANLLMLLFSIIAFYGIIRIVIPGKKDWQYSLACLPFGASPFIAGMTGYFSTDWFCVCFITVLIYCLLKRKWVLGSVCAILFCLTKEPALIAYTGLLFGFVINYFISIKGCFGYRIKKILRSLHLYLLLIPYFIWFVIYLIMGPWSAGDGGFGFNVQYVINKLKVFGTFEFNWIYVLTIFITLIYLLAKHRFGENLYWIIPLLCSNFFLLIFNCLYKTANHPRYIDSFISVSILLTVLLLWKTLDGRYLPMVFYVCLFIINVFSCYSCFDPLTEIAFDSNCKGIKELYTTSSLPMGDAAIYNKEMMLIEKPICDAIKHSLDDNNEIALPIYNNSIYAYNGMSSYINFDTNEDILRWNANYGRRVSFVDDELLGNEDKKIYYFENIEELNELIPEDKCLSIIYIKGINSYSLDDKWILKNSEEYKYRGWIITRDVIVRVKKD